MGILLLCYLQSQNCFFDRRMRGDWVAIVDLIKCWRHEQGSWNSGTYWVAAENGELILCFGIMGIDYQFFKDWLMKLRRQNLTICSLVICYNGVSDCTKVLILLRFSHLHTLLWSSRDSHYYFLMIVMGLRVIFVCSLLRHADTEYWEWGSFVIGCL